eukprot:1184349-Rhodomonas_salina.5
MPASATPNHEVRVTLGDDITIAVLVLLRQPAGRWENVCTSWMYFMAKFEERELLMQSKQVCLTNFRSRCLLTLSHRSCIDEVN